MGTISDIRYTYKHNFLWLGFMMAPFDLSTTLLVSSVAGLLSSYLAYRRGKNPILWFLVGALFGMLGVFALFFSGHFKKKQAASVAKLAEPKPYLAGPTNKFWYYLDAAGTQVGPLSYNGMTAAWKEGTVPVTAFVWHEDLTDWQALQDLVRFTGAKDNSS